MALEFKFTCPLPNGVHARPASVLAEAARRFRAEILITNRRNGQVGNAKSVLAMVAAEIRFADECTLSVSGPDEQQALLGLTSFIRNQFPNCDAPLPPSAPAQNSLQRLPRCLRDAGATLHPGTPVVHGIGHGRIARVTGFRLAPGIPTSGAREPAQEISKLDAAVAAVTQAYEERLSAAGSRLEQDLVRAHLAIARDPELRARLHQAAREGNRTAAGALLEARAHFAAMLAASPSLLLRERIPDLDDVCRALLLESYGAGAVCRHPPLTGDAIVLAETLSPEQFLSLDRAWLKGLVLTQAGTTSHAVILARSFGVPTLIGVALTGAPVVREGAEAVPASSSPEAQPVKTIAPGSEAFVDGELGLLVTELTAAAQRYYAMEQRRLAGRQERQRRLALLPAMTADGHQVEIAANIGTPAEALEAFAHGAEGIGLFRTEMLFLERAAPPTEQEQFESYRQTLESAGDRPVIFRTFDIGGDKPIPWLSLPPESNPFLGCRAVRLYPQLESLFRSQLRALIRASAHGRLKLMLPMVARLEEVRWSKQLIAEEQANCAAQGLSFNPAMPVGIMLEVPAAAFIVDALCREVDFFSVGSNDLMQYFAAADRADPRLAALSDPFQPAFLRLLAKIVADVHAGGKWVGLCGELGGQTQALPLLAGLGFDEVSAATTLLAGLKTELAGWPMPLCRELVQRTLACSTGEEVRTLLEDFVAQAKQGLPLLEPELVVLETQAATKEEAVKELADRLYVLDRTEHPREVEEAVWQRELVYSTGFGFGFAIPHCQTNAVTASSLAVLKLRTPVAWGSADGQPVGVILLLAIRQSDQAGRHLKVLAQLARKLMHEEFREQLIQADEEQAICKILEAKAKG